MSCAALENELPVVKSFGWKSSPRSGICNFRLWVWCMHRDREVGNVAAHGAVGVAVNQREVIA